MISSSLPNYFIYNIRIQDVPPKLKKSKKQYKPRVRDTNSVLTEANGMCKITSHSMDLEKERRPGTIPKEVRSSSLGLALLTKLLLLTRCHLDFKYYTKRSVPPIRLCTDWLTLQLHSEGKLHDQFLKWLCHCRLFQFYSFLRTTFWWFIYIKKRWLKPSL